MTRVRSALAFAAGFALLVAGQGRSQPQGFLKSLLGSPTPLAVVVLPGIDDPAVVADLKLSDGQVKALVARRQAAWDEEYTTVWAPDKLAARTAATDAAMKTVLTPAQYQRAAQLGAQNVLLVRPFTPTNEPAPPTLQTLRVTVQTVQRYPELSDVFGLTEEQKKTLTDARGKAAQGFGPGLALTAPQRKAAAEFMGPLLANGWTVKTDPRMAAIPTQPRSLRLLEAKDVRADLGVADEQGKAITGVSERWVKLSSDRVTVISPKEAAAVATALAAETEKVLAANLTPAQATRLQQIDRQNKGGWTGGTHVEQFYMDAASAQEFGVTPEQAKALDGVWAAFREDAARAFLAGEPLAATQKRLAELTAARRAKAEAVLSPDQAAKVNDAYGARFAGSIVPDSFRAPGGRSPSPVPGPSIDERRAAAFGRYTGEFARLAADGAVQAELKLTPEQVKKAGEVAAELRTKFGFSPPQEPDAFAKTYAERSDYIAAELAKLLTPTQGKRFREVMMQSREAVPRLPAPSTLVPSAVAYPGAAEAVGLTADQRKALLAGTAPAEVLTAGQKEALARMLGEPFAAARPAPPTPFTRSSRLPVVLANPGSSLEAGLGLSPEQATAVAAAREAYLTAAFAARPAPGIPVDAAARAKSQADAAAEFEKAVAAALTPAQRKRLPEVTRQFAAAADLADALTAPDVAAALDLTADQKTRLAELDGEATRLQRLLATQPGADTPDRRLAFRLRDAADERLLAVLTDAQRARWTGLTGPPVPGLVKTIPGGFGFGGPGGGGFGGAGGGSGVFTR